MMKHRFHFLTNNELESVVNKKDQSSDYYFISMNTLIKQTIV